MPQVGIPGRNRHHATKVVVPHARNLILVRRAVFLVLAVILVQSFISYEIKVGAALYDYRGVILVIDIASVLGLILGWAFIDIAKHSVVSFLKFFVVAGIVSWPASIIAINVGSLLCCPNTPLWLPGAVAHIIIASFAALAVLHSEEQDILYRISR